MSANVNLGASQRRHVESMVDQMAKLQQQNGRPLTQEQRTMLIDRLLQLYANGQNPSNEVVTHTAAQLLRSFAAPSATPPTPAAAAPNMSAPPQGPQQPLAPAPAASTANNVMGGAPGPRPTGMPAAPPSAQQIQQAMAFLIAQRQQQAQQQGAAGANPLMPGGINFANLIRPGAPGGLNPQMLAALAAAARPAAPRCVIVCV